MSEEEIVPKRRYGRIITIVIVVIILLSIGLFFFHINGNSLDFSSSEIRIVVTGSMDGDPQPYEISTIPIDSMIMVHRLSDAQKDELRVGDVITFTQDGILKTHRIISIDQENKKMVTKGDANPTADPAIDYSDISGKVVGVSHIVGQAVTVVKNLFTQSIWIVLLVVVVIITMIYSVIEIVKMLREKED